MTKFILDVEAWKKKNNSPEVYMSYRDTKPQFIEDHDVYSAVNDFLQNNGYTVTKVAVAYQEDNKEEGK